MKEANYEWLAGALLERSGIVLGDNKLYLLEARLTTIAERMGARDLDELIERLRAGAASELLMEVVEAMTTNETSFFRDPRQFELLFARILPKLMRARASTQSIRIWSAACSTGQEPYSLCMGIDQRLHALRDWKVEIVGTDLSDRALAKAREGLFHQFEVQRGLPMQYLMRYFDREGKHYRLKPEIRARVGFRKLNLKGPLPQAEPFDVIFCRNVLIYFDAETKRELLERMVEVLAPDGYIVVGGGETILGVTDRLRRIGVQNVFAYCNAATAPELVDVA